MSGMFQIIFICLVTCKVGTTPDLQRLNQGLFDFTFPSFYTALGFSCLKSGFNFIQWIHSFSFIRTFFIITLRLSFVENLRTF